MGALKNLQLETPQSLTQELLGTAAVMVGEFSHFGGKYPNHEEPHQHRAYWRAKITNNYVTGLAKVQYKLWRHIKTKNGELIHCPACLHGRYIEFCERIEAISHHYLRLDTLAYLAVPNRDRDKTAAKIRKYNSRVAIHSDLITFVTFPLQGGTTIFLHDDPDYLGGEELPSERKALFELVMDWAQPPKGKRAGHGLKAWSEKGPKSARPEETQQTEQPGGGQGKGPKIGYVWGSDYWLVMKLITEYLDTDENANGLKIPEKELPVSKFLELLNLAGVDYALEGDINIPNAPKTGETKAKGQEKQPAPIYLAGIGEVT
jgi:hypothetical protein